MKKAFTLTFHWATNYGAVLQAYALQKFLLNEGYDAKIINYIPAAHKKTLLRCFMAKNPKKILSNLQELSKEKKLEEFRKANLRLTKLYINSSELRRENWENALYITGSDQIWNPYFTMSGEGKITTAYYLDFTTGKKISYAASLGATKITDEMSSVITPLLKDFDKITVREKSAVNLFENIGLKAELICDPVFLLKPSDYEALLTYKKTKTDTVFKYILHDSHETGEQILTHIQNSQPSYCVKEAGNMSMEEWLSSIRDAGVVITNSFHATAFAILFHVPFISVLIPGSGMNDRILTLLEKTCLSHRAVSEYKEENIDILLQEEIDWQKTDIIVENMRNNAINFLQSL